MKAQRRSRNGNRAVAYLCQLDYLRAFNSFYYLIDYYVKLNEGYSACSAMDSTSTEARVGRLKKIASTFY